MGTLFEMPAPEARSAADRLNPEQRRAVEHGEGPLVVIAGAGTGKTLVIVERVRRLLESHPELFAGEILALTYTHKAAGEMAARVRKALGERGKGLVATTFHTFCRDVLKQSRPSVRMIDDVEHWILLRRNLGRLGLVHYRRRVEPGQFLNDFTKFFSRCQDELVSAEDYLRYMEKQVARAGKDVGADAREELEKQLEVARAYTESEGLLREKDLLTFGGSLMETVRLLERDEAALRALRMRYRFILVDEFQDTNVAQIRLLGLVAGDARNLFVVGDDDQAIYRFRGASFGSFRMFEREFLPRTSEAYRARETRVLLTRNYRSTKKILRLADTVIRNNGETNRMFPDKQLVTQNPEGDPIRIAGLASEEAEAEWIAAQMEQEHARGRPWSAFAVLYRVHRHREALVPALERRGIPFVIRRLSVFTNPIVRDLVAGLRWIDRPHDNVALARLLAIPQWDFTPEDLVRTAHRAGKNPRKSLWTALGAPPESKDAPEVAEDARRETDDREKGKRSQRLPESVPQLIGLHARLREFARREAVTAVFDELTMALGILPLSDESDRRAFSAFRNFIEKWHLANVPEADAAEKLEDESASRTEGRKRQGLREFLEYFRYFQQAGGSVTLDEEHRGDEAMRAETPPGDAVQLMTVHTAKGLEFEQVFVMRLNRGSFPLYNRRPFFEFPDALMKDELPSGDYHVLEERRLFYVALTRAKRRLTLTTLVRDSSKPSPFLEDIEQEMAHLAKDVMRLNPAPPSGLFASTEAQGSSAAGATGDLFATLDRQGYQSSEITDWAATFQPPLGLPLELSAESIEGYRNCPQKFLFGNRWQVREQPSAALTFGSVIHSTVQHAVAEMKERGLPTLERMLALFDEEWRKRKGAGFEDGYQEETYREEGRAQLRKLHARLSVAAPAMRDQEKAFTLPMNNDIVLNGRIDQVNALPGGSFEIIDYKTGRARDARELRRNVQISLYALAARDALDLGVPPVTFHYLENDSLVTLQRDRKDLLEAEAIVQEVAGGVRAGAFPPKAGFLCRFCDYRLICPAHERTSAAADEPNE